MVYCSGLLPVMRFSNRCRFCFWFCFLPQLIPIPLHLRLLPLEFGFHGFHRDLRWGITVLRLGLIFLPAVFHHPPKHLSSVSTRFGGSNPIFRFFSRFLLRLRQRHRRRLRHRHCSSYRHRQHYSYCRSHRDRYRHRYFCLRRHSRRQGRRQCCRYRYLPVHGDNGFTNSFPLRGILLHSVGRAGAIQSLVISLVFVDLVLVIDENSSQSFRWIPIPIYFEGTSTCPPVHKTRVVAIKTGRPFPRIVGARFMSYPEAFKTTQFELHIWVMANCGDLGYSLCSLCLPPRQRSQPFDELPASSTDYTIQPPAAKTETIRTFAELMDDSQASSPRVLCPGFEILIFCVRTAPSQAMAQQQHWFHLQTDFPGIILIPYEVPIRRGLFLYLFSLFRGLVLPILFLDSSWFTEPVLTDSLYLLATFCLVTVYQLDSPTLDDPFARVSFDNHLWWPHHLFHPVSVWTMTFLDLSSSSSRVTMHGFRFAVWWKTLLGLSLYSVPSTSFGSSFWGISTILGSNSGNLSLHGFSLVSFLCIIGGVLFQLLFQLMKFEGLPWISINLMKLWQDEEDVWFHYYGVIPFGLKGYITSGHCCQWPVAVNLVCMATQCFGFGIIRLSTSWTRSNLSHSTVLSTPMVTRSITTFVEVDLMLFTLCFWETSYQVCKHSCNDL